MSDNVAAPGRAAPVHTLLAATAPRPWDNRVADGVSFEPALCSGAHVRISACGLAPDAVIPEVCTEPVEYHPFDVTTGVQLSTFQSPAVRGRSAGRTESYMVPAREAASRLLEACKYRMVESEFWTGATRDAKLTPHLGSTIEEGLRHVAVPGDILNTQVEALSFRQALILLNDALAAHCTGQAMIHMPAGLLDSLSDDLLTFDGEFYRTRSGHLIVPGQGYPGTSPATIVDPDPLSPTVWVYATGQVFSYESPSRVLEDTDGVVGQNDVNVLASRTYVLGFDPCLHKAVCVDPTL